MTAQAPSGGYRSAPSGNSPWVSGGTTFAGVLMLLNGVLGVFQGIAAIAEDDVYARVDDYVYRINLTGWGWILLIIGLIALFTGWGILSGAQWARAAGIVLAALSMVTQFLFLPYQPVWSIVMLGIAAFVIRSLAVYHPEPRRR
ncbi:DUF7144 family membrane protein [Streptomyces sp. NPDC003832]